MGNQGTSTVNFGAFPGASDTSVTVTGQGGIIASSLVEAWISLTATADHTADEHWVETIDIKAGNIVAGTGFTIYAKNTNQLTEQALDQTNSGDQLGFVGSSTNGRGTRLYGQWSVNWVWN